MLLAEFQDCLRRLQPALEQAVTDELRAHAKDVAKAAAEKLGTQQPGWAPLSQSTIDKHGDTPGVDSGDMKGISPGSEGITVIETKEPGTLAVFGIGSALEYAKWFEEGTVKNYPRPFLEPALIESLDEMEKRLERVVDRTIDEVFGG